MGMYLILVSSLLPVQGLFLVLLSQATGNLEPKFNTTTEDIIVSEGGRALLPCSVEFLGNYQVIWVNPRKILMTLMDRRMIDDTRVSVERPYIQQWNLLIRQLRYNDSGVYECRLNVVPEQKKRVNLIVQVPPTIFSHLSSDKFTLKEGETVTLICNVTGIPTPNVTWYKRNYRKGEGKERIGTEGEVLIIHNVTRQCDDIYECFVDNGVPPAVSKAIRVEVEFPPEVVLPNKRMGQRLQKETHLECIIYASPLSMAAWRRSGHDSDIQKSDKYEIDLFRNDMENSFTLVLKIKHLEKSDYGKYVCRANNHLSEDEEEMTLYEVYPPTTTTTTTLKPTTLFPIYRVESEIPDTPKTGHHVHAKPQESIADKLGSKQNSNGRTSASHSSPSSENSRNGYRDEDDLLSIASTSRSSDVLSHSIFAILMTSLIPVYAVQVSMT